ncbi:fibrocystin-L-like [Ruditapes philippinarum]|uniref:fibrocystin-L-like n=1 Tax=Ruditapes philippinarum TaxID=129788 RepID=UPI00295A7171|nr:fibrocystin-L-like [Ruditapes philippinarum]
MTEEDHYVKVKVDGDVVADSDLCGGDPTSFKCTFKPQSKYTPTIETFTPQSGKPELFLSMRGKLVSDRYGSNMAAATNLKSEKLLRVYAGPQDCGLKDGDTLYVL